MAYLKIFVIEVEHQNRNGRTILDKVFNDWYKANDYCHKLLSQEKYATNAYYIKEYKLV